MAVPEEIRRVERPTNTIVTVYGKNKDKYAVRQRTGCRNIEGRRVPVEGRVIGHIIDGKYVAAAGKPPDTGPELKNWANVVLCDRLFKDILYDLMRFYGLKEAMQIYCMAILRVCDHGIKDRELKDAYEESFLSELYPDVPLSKNTVCDRLNSIGKTCSRIFAFMQDRASKACRGNVIIDGMLKSDESIVNSLSDYSHRALGNSTREISVLYAYDTKSEEIVCSAVYPGNMTDNRAMEDFIEACGITEGLIVADKGFTESAARKAFGKNPDLHFMLPLKRSAKAISEYRMYSFNGLLEGYSGITYRKEKEGASARWLYSFRDAAKAADEERTYLDSHKGRYDPDDHAERRKGFGTIVFESDVDMEPPAVYKGYKDRWLIELIFRFYKDVNEFDETREHDDYSVMASEFVNFLATVLTNRLVKRFSETRTLEGLTYGKAMKTLARGKKIKVGGEWRLRRLSVCEAEILADLGLIDKPIMFKKQGRGRPPKKRSA
jgi:hypothetical protein